MHFFDELRDPDTRLPNGPLPPLFNFSQYELSLNSSLNSRLIPTHMQGQQTVAASGGGGSSTNSTTVNSSATGVSTAGTSNVNEKPITPTNHSNNSPPSSIVPGATASASTININGPGESDAMNSLDEHPATSGDSINKDRS